MDKEVLYYPPFPWRLQVQGTLVVTVHLVDAARAARALPSGVRVQKVLPGKTLGALYFATYGPGSALEYNELIAISALVRHAGRWCAWVQRLDVDSPASVKGGREALGVPKVPGRFRFKMSLGRWVDVSTPEGTQVCLIRTGSPFWLWRQRLRFATLHQDVRQPEQMWMLGNQVEGRLGLASALVDIGPSSPLAGLGLGPALFALCLKEASALLGGAPYMPVRAFPTEG